MQIDIGSRVFPREIYRTQQSLEKTLLTSEKLVSNLSPREKCLAYFGSTPSTIKVVDASTTALSAFLNSSCSEIDSCCTSADHRTEQCHRERKLKGRDPNTTFLRLYDAAMRSRERKEQRVRIFAQVLIDAEMSPRESKFVTGRMVKPFHPDINPQSIAKHRSPRGTDLLIRLDALGENRKRALQDRERLRLHCCLENCTFRPNIPQTKLMSGHGSAVHEYLYATGTISSLAARPQPEKVCIESDQQFGSRSKASALSRQISAKMSKTQWQGSAEIDLSSEKVPHLLTRKQLAAAKSRISEHKAEVQEDETAWLLVPAFQAQDESTIGGSGLRQLAQTARVGTDSKCYGAFTATGNGVAKFGGEKATSFGSAQHLDSDGLARGDRPDSESTDTAQNSCCNRLFATTLGGASSDVAEVSENRKKLIKRSVNQSVASCRRFAQGKGCHVHATVRAPTLSSSSRPVRRKNSNSVQNSDHGVNQKPEESLCSKRQNSTDFYPDKYHLRSEHNRSAAPFENTGECTKRQKILRYKHHHHDFRARKPVLSPSSAVKRECSKVQSLLVCAVDSTLNNKKQERRLWIKNMRNNVEMQAFAAFATKRFLLGYRSEATLVHIDDNILQALFALLEPDVLGFIELPGTKIQAQKQAKNVESTLLSYSEKPLNIDVARELEWFLSSCRHEAILRICTISSSFSSAASDQIPGKDFHSPLYWNGSFADNLAVSDDKVSNQCSFSLGQFKLHRPLKISFQEFKIISLRLLDYRSSSGYLMRTVLHGASRLYWNKVLKGLPKNKRNLVLCQTVDRLSSPWSTTRTPPWSRKTTVLVQESARTLEKQNNSKCLATSYSEVTCNIEGSLAMANKYESTDLVPSKGTKIIPLDCKQIHLGDNQIKSGSDLDSCAWSESHSYTKTARFAIKSDAGYDHRRRQPTKEGRSEISSMQKTKIYADARRSDKKNSEILQNKKMARAITIMQEAQMKESESLIECSFQPRISQRSVMLSRGRSQAYATPTLSTMAYKR